MEPKRSALAFRKTSRYEYRTQKKHWWYNSIGVANSNTSDSRTLRYNNAYHTKIYPHLRFHFAPVVIIVLLKRSQIARSRSLVLVYRRHPFLGQVVSAGYLLCVMCDAARGLKLQTLRDSS